MKPLVLLTNDDGHDAAGLRAVREAMLGAFRVVTVAPASEMSGVSHAITLTRPLTVEDLGDDVHAVDGTPADCVNIALHHVLKGERPLVVVSGCNMGGNMGDDVSYSGTVGGAREAALFGIAALAVSQVRGGPSSDYGPAGALTAQLVAALVARPGSLPAGTFLNMNLPEGAPAGVSQTRLARRVYRDPIREDRQADGRRFLWVGGHPEWQADPGTDYHAVTRLGHASVTLLRTDVTADDAPGALPGIVAAMRTGGERRA